MSVNGIYSNNISDMYTSNTTAKEKTENVDKADKTVDTESAENTQEVVKQDDTAAVYDKTKLSEADRKAIVAQLKADQEKRQAQLTDLVQSMLSKQTSVFGQATDIWKFLAKGDFEVDEETKKKAQEDISEDGYWGVNQTSDRIVSFATALAGNDADALEKMKEAFIKGYKQAEKQWGGELPEISKKTYDAVMEKFDKLTKKNETTTEGTSDKTPADKTNKEETVTTTEDGTVIAK